MDEFIKRTFVNTFLDAPILEGSARELFCILDAPEDALPHAKRRKRALYLRYIDLSDKTLTIYNPRNLAELVQLSPREGQSATTDIQDTAQGLADKFFDGVLKELSTKIGMPLGFHPRPPVQESLVFYQKAKFFEAFVDKVACSRVAGVRGIVSHKSQDHLLLGDQYSALWSIESEGIAMCMPYEAILMFKDMFLARSNVLYAAPIVRPELPGLPVLVLKVFDWMEGCLTRYGNQGYEVLKGIEAMCKTYCVKMHDRVFSDGDVFRRIKEDVESKERKCIDTEYSAETQAQRLETILSECPDVASVIELFGLQKLCGHPMIDPRVGGESSAAEASAQKNTTFRDAMRLRNNWARMYIEGYVRRTGRWPPLVFTPEGKKTKLFQLYGLRERNLTRNSYDITDLTEVRFNKHAEFDYHSNFLDLMDDKALSYYLDEFRATWRKNIRLRSQRRLLLEMLSRPDVSIRAIVEIVESGLVPEEWLIVSLYPKEREFKLSPRMFSMMVFEMRAFFACIEANVADHIFPYLPQQTMTLSKLEILERFADYTKPIVSDELAKLFFEVDLTRWNLRWRDLPIRLIGDDLNDIFGLSRSYTFVHEFFEKSMILVRVAGYEPTGLDHSPPPSSNLLWYDHKGGFEGITQKHWTIATYSMIDLALHEFNVDYQIHGQADNQTIAVLVKLPIVVDRKAYLRRLSERIKTAIAESCRRVGQEAKPDECVESTSVLTYSKNFYLNGVLEHSSLKAYSRVFPRSMSEIPSLHNNASSIGSACLAAAEHLKTPILGYRLMVFHLARYLLECRTSVKVETLRLSFAGRQTFSLKLICRLLCTPSTLGGLPVPTPAQFLYKGGSDQLSKDLSGLYLMPRFCHGYLGGLIATLRRGAFTDKYHNAESILSDPYSLPISSPPLVESRLQSTNLPKIKTLTKNREIGEILSAAVDEHEGDLIASLMQVHPFNPQLLSDVLGASVSGVKRTLAKMFTSTRTIQALPSDSEDVGSVILSHGVSQFVSLMMRLRGVTSDPAGLPKERSFLLAEELRRTWTLTSTQAGRPCPQPEGLSNEVPLSWEIEVDRFDWCPNGVIGASVASTYDSSSPCQGMHRLYLGSETQEKRSQHGYKIVVSSSAEKDFSLLLKIATQPGVSEDFQELVASIGASRAGVDLRDLIPLTSRAVGGSIAHRYASSFSLQTASVIGNHNITSHTTFHSNHAGILSASPVDYPVMFQEFFVAAAGLATTALHLGKRPGPLYLRFKVPAALTELPTNRLEPERFLSAPVPVFRDNSILFASDIRLLRSSGPVFSGLVGREHSVLGLPPPLLFDSLISRALRKGAAGASLADNVSGRSLHIHADILEYQGAGILDVIEGAARALAKFTIGAIFSRTSSNHRWQLIPLVSTLSSTLARSLALTFSHPVFHKDEAVASYLSYDAMQYGSRRRHLKIATRLSRRSLELVTDAAALSSTAITLFDDDEPTSSVDAALIAIRARLLAACVNGEIARDLAVFYDRRHTLRLLSTGSTPEEKIGALYDAASILRYEAERNTWPGLHQSLNAVIGGEAVTHYSTSLVVELRALRASAVTRVGLSALKAKRMSTIHAIDSSVSFRECPPEPFDWGVMSTGRYREDLSYNQFVISRRNSRLLSHLPAVTVSFLRADSLLVSNTAVVIGSGHGGAAAVLKSLEVPRIIVHDLREDVDPEIWGSDNHGLPVLDRIATKSVVERSWAGYSGSGGNCYEDDTWDGLFWLAPADVLLIVDVPVSSHDNWTKLIGLASARYAGQCIVTRWIIPEGSTEGLLGMLSCYLMDIQAIRVEAGYGWSELVVKGRIRRVSTRGYAVNLDTISNCTASRVLLPPLDPDTVYREYFADLDLAARDQTISQVSGAHFEASLRRALRSYNSGEWTRILRFFTVKSLRNQKRPDAIKWMAEVVCGIRPWEVKVGRTIMTVSASTANIAFLATEACRMF